MGSGHGPAEGGGVQVMDGADAIARTHAETANRDGGKFVHCEEEKKNPGGGATHSGSRRFQTQLTLTFGYGGRSGTHGPWRRPLNTNQTRITANTDRKSVV